VNTDSGRDYPFSIRILERPSGGGHRPSRTLAAVALEAGIQSSGGEGLMRLVLVACR